MSDTAKSGQIVQSAVIKHSYCIFWQRNDFGIRLVFFSSNFLIPDLKRRLFLSYPSPLCHVSVWLINACRFINLTSQTVHKLQFAVWSDHHVLGYDRYNPLYGRTFSRKVCIGRVSHRYVFESEFRKYSIGEFCNRIQCTWNPHLSFFSLEVCWLEKLQHNHLYWIRCLLTQELMEHRWLFLILQSNLT